MTVQASPILRAVVLPAPDAHPQETPTRRLLNGLGHDVARADSPTHALELLKSEFTDLVVIDVSNANINRGLIAELAKLTPELRPRQLAIFTDRMDAELRNWRMKMSPSRMHVFLKPLHVHGLLAVLRQMETHAETDAPVHPV